MKVAGIQFVTIASSVQKKQKYQYFCDVDILQAVRILSTPLSHADSSVIWKNLNSNWINDQ